MLCLDLEVDRLGFDSDDDLPFFFPPLIKLNYITFKKKFRRGTHNKSKCNYFTPTHTPTLDSVEEKRRRGRSEEEEDKKRRTKAVKRTKNEKMKRRKGQQNKPCFATHTETHTERDRKREALSFRQTDTERKKSFVGTTGCKECDDGTQRDCAIGVDDFTRPFNAARCSFISSSTNMSIMSRSCNLSTRRESDSL